MTKHVTIDMAAKATGQFTVERFDKSGSTKDGRHRLWLQARKRGVGGSDMSTILGLNKYQTPSELWDEKTGRAEPQDLTKKWAVAKGNNEEPLLRGWFRDRHPEWVIRDGTDKSLTSKTHPIMRASLDGFIYDPETDSWGVLEIKTASHYKGVHDWHDELGNLRAPDYYMAQVTHYMAVTGFTWGYFYADIGESEPVEVRFTRDERDIEAVIHAAEDFWGYVERNERPQLTAADIPKVYPQDDGLLPEADDHTEFDRLCAEYREHKQAEAQERAEARRIAEQLTPMIGQHNGLRTDQWRATYATQQRGEYTIPASSTRVLRVTNLTPKEQ